MAESTIGPYDGSRVVDQKAKGAVARERAKSGPPIFQDLRGKWHKTSSGDPIRFGYNCKSGCSDKGVKPGGCCPKGYHVCAEPRCGESHSLQQHGSK